MTSWAGHIRRADPDTLDDVAGRLSRATDARRRLSDERGQLARYAGGVNPGDRVELLKKLAERLAERDYSWDDRMLILRQFGFPTRDPDRWEGTDRAFVLWCIEDGGDEALVSLDEYLFGGSSRDVLDPSDLPWEAGTFKLFISHTSANAEFVGRIRTLYARWRIDAFVAHTTIEPTREWEQVIEAALNSCDALAALVTEDLIRSSWCDQEIGFCYARRVPIVPVRFGADPHGFIGKYQAARPRGQDWSYVADAIFRALLRHATIRNAMAAPVVHRYAGTGSFNAARSNFELLREVPAEAWTRELLEVAERASRDNPQIASANLVTDDGPRPVPEAFAELVASARERLGMNAREADDDVPIDTGDDDIPF